MKAIVMETRKNEAAVLLKDGTFRIVRGRYTVGETIEYRENTRPVLRRWVAAAAALVLIFGTGGGFWYDANCVAYGEVSFDASASIVYTVNKKSRVLEVRAVNNEAIGIVETLEQGDIRFMPISDAIERTIAIMEADGYLDAENEDYILLNVSADSGKMQGHLTEAVENGMERGQEHDPTMEIRIDHSDRATARRATERGMSPGRYAAWEQAADGRGPEEYAEMPVREIMTGKSSGTDNAAAEIPNEPGFQIMPQQGQPDGASEGRNAGANRDKPDSADSSVPERHSEAARSDGATTEERPMLNSSAGASERRDLPSPDEKAEDRSGLEGPAANPEMTVKTPAGISTEAGEAQPAGGSESGSFGQPAAGNESGSSGQPSAGSESGSPGQSPSNEMNGSMNDGQKDAPSGQQGQPGPF